ncbi:MAG: hybrid sensor histidine kinase/response regulator [Planctomycetota bacterium]|nr:MAG: hybrid sensor histidine kinase/response regulator [Planctomycetota bacterium]
MSTGQTHRKRALVAGGDAESRRSAASTLEGAGWEVVEAETLDQARQHLSAGVDLALLDGDLPDGNGDAGEQLRASDALAGTPTLLLAETGTNIADPSSYETGLDLLLTRPVEPLVLSSAAEVLFRAGLAEKRLARCARERDGLAARERSARAEIENAHRLKDDFLATLSHELRTPLNAIVGWSELLKLGQLDDEEVREAIDAIERNAKAQTQMIADLLDVSRITSGKLRLDAKVVNVAEIVEAALAAVAPAAAAKEIAVELALDRLAGPVLGDAARLQQVVWNLLSNAVKFTPRGGRIIASLRRTDDVVEIAVADTGPGVSPELLPHVFERFSHGAGAATRAYAGLGLGLALVKHLVEMHGGSVRAESPGVGKGATFTLALPVASVRPMRDSPAAGAEERVDAPHSRPAPLEGIRVMVVDDDADARRLTKRVLAKSGVESREAASVEEALTAIDGFAPHVLISDLGMPGQDGFDLIRQVRSRGYTFHDLPAVALTAFARTEERRQALLAGYQVHLAKPVDAFELTAVIATLVGRTGD